MKGCYWQLRLTSRLDSSCNCFLQSVLTKFFCLVHDCHSRPQIPPIPYLAKACKSCVEWSLSVWSQTSSSFYIYIHNLRPNTNGTTGGFGQVARSWPLLNLSDLRRSQLLTCLHPFQWPTLLTFAASVMLGTLQSETLQVGCGY